MKKHYDFSKGKKNPYAQPLPADCRAWEEALVDAVGGGVSLRPPHAERMRVRIFASPVRAVRTARRDRTRRSRLTGPLATTISV